MRHPVSVRTSRVALELATTVAFDISRGDARFLEWVGASLDKEAVYDDEEDEVSPGPDPN